MTLSTDKICRDQAFHDDTEWLGGYSAHPTMGVKGGENEDGFYELLVESEVPMLVDMIDVFVPMARLSVLDMLSACLRPSSLRSTRSGAHLTVSLRKPMNSPS
jgi:hypothetical protein